MDSCQKMNRSMVLDFLVMGLATVAGGLVVHALTRSKSEDEKLAELLGTYGGGANVGLVDSEALLAEIRNRKARGE